MFKVKYGTEQWNETNLDSTFYYISYKPTLGGSQNPYFSVSVMSTDTTQTPL